MVRSPALDEGQGVAEPSKQIPLWGHGGNKQTARRMTDLLRGRRADCLPPDDRQRISNRPARGQDPYMKES
jgi:hypothetical protein